MLSELGATVMIRRATVEDAPAAAALCRHVFRHTYGAAIPEAVLYDYLERTFSPVVMRNALACQANYYWVAQWGDELAGVCKLSATAAPPCVLATQPMELVNLYVSAAYRQCGIGAALMHAVNAALTNFLHDALWLCVWEHNANAIRFYQRWGFQQVGRHTIWVDHVAFRDLVMVKKLKY